MLCNKGSLGHLLAALLIGLASFVGVLLLAQPASAGTMPEAPEQSSSLTSSEGLSEIALWSTAPQSDFAPADIRSVEAARTRSRRTTVRRPAAAGRQRSASSPLLAHGTPVSIALAPPTATVPSGQSIAYTVTATDALGVSWTATSTATYSIDLAAGGSWSANLYTAEKDGTWTVTAEYEELTDSATLTVTNVAPEVDAGGPYFGTAGSDVILSATTVDDPGGGPFDFSWDLDNDGQFDDAFVASPTFSSTVAGPTPYIVRVRVADPGGLTGTDTANVTISPAALDHIILSPPSTSIQAGDAQLYTVEAFDEYDNSRGDVSAQSTYQILEPGHGGSWNANVYTSANYGDWTVEATYVETTIVSDTASLTVLSPDLHLVKTADQASVEAGDRLTYTLTYSNTGNQAATGLIITDTLDTNVTYFSASPEPNGEVSGSYFWLFSDLPVDGRDQIMVTVSANRPLTNGTRLTNTAWIDSYQTVPLSATVATTVTARPVLSIAKLDSTDPITQGHTLLYTILITNTGNENATGVTVVENYDPNVSVAWTSPPADVGSEDRVWTLPALPVDTPTTIQVGATVTAPLEVGTVLYNEVTLDSDQTSPISATQETSATSGSEFDFSILDHPDPVQAGGELWYVIDYDNYGETAYNVVVRETYDSRVQFLSADPPPDVGDNVWLLGNLHLEGGTIVVRVQVDTPLPNGTQLLNEASIRSTGTPPTIAYATTTVGSASDLALSVTDSPDPVEAGHLLTYTLRYTNAGNADATGVVITATLDSNSVFFGATPPPDGGSGEVWTWNIPSIPGEGGQGEIVINVSVPVWVPDATRLDFMAELTDAEGDSLVGETWTTVYAFPDLVIGKRGDGHAPSLFMPGQPMTYVVTYSNEGYEDAQDIVVSTVLPDGTQYVDAGYGWQSLDGLNYTCSVGDLPAHSSQDAITFTVEYLPVEPQEIGAPEFHTPFSIATGGGSGGDANPADNSTSVFIGVPDLVITGFTVSAEPGSLVPNEPVLFTVTVKNQGTGVAWNPEACLGDPFQPTACGGWYVDFFYAPVASYGYERDGDFYATYQIPIDPGEEQTLAFSRSFGAEEIEKIHKFFVKADNYHVHNYGLVPEFNEMNNLGEPIQRLYLPLIKR